MTGDLVERLRSHDYDHAYNLKTDEELYAERDEAADRIEALEAKLAEKDALLREVTCEPTPCPSCHGQGRIWVYRIDDRKYPKKCNKCEGTGIARATLAKIKDATDAD